MVGALVLLAWIPLRQRPGVGTISNVVVIGLAVDGALAVLPAPSVLAARIVLVVGGVLLNAVATAAYIGAHLGPGPRDGLMTGLVRRTGGSVRIVRTSIEVAVVATGWLLGGTLGLGTVVYARPSARWCNCCCPDSRSPTAGAARAAPKALPRPGTQRHQRDGSQREKRDAAEAHERPGREDQQRGQLHAQARHRGECRSLRTVDPVLQPRLGDDQHTEVERVEGSNGGQGNRAPSDGGQPEAAGRDREQARQHAVRQPADPLGQRGAGRAGQADREDGERHRERHPAIGREHREVLLDGVQPADQAHGRDGDPQDGVAHGAGERGTDRPSGSRRRCEEVPGTSWPGRQRPGSSRR